MTDELQSPSRNVELLKRLRAPHTAYTKVRPMRVLLNEAADAIEALDLELAQCDADWRKRGEIIREQRAQLAKPSETAAITLPAPANRCETAEPDYKALYTELRLAVTRRCCKSLSVMDGK